MPCCYIPSSKVIGLSVSEKKIHVFIGLLPYMGVVPTLVM